MPELKQCFGCTDIVDDILLSHLIKPAELRADQFEKFYQARKSALLALVSNAMGKALEPALDFVAEDDEDEAE